MADPDVILAWATSVANGWLPLAVAWHAALLLLAAACLRGWRPSIRLLGVIVAAPLASVSAVAWLTGNAFNGALFAALAVTLAAQSRGLPDVRARFADRAWASLGGGFVLLGALYPHFLVGAGMLTYGVAAPFGLLPCPTLMVATGIALMAAPAPGIAWSAPLVLADLLFGVIGVFRLQVMLDVGLLAGACLLGARVVVQGLTDRVSATADERGRRLAGDELIPAAVGALTHAITIHRPPSAVWPWLVQMGAGSRAGWYSYDALDNGGRTSAARIIPALQQVATGDVFPALPGVTDGFTVLAIDAPRSLVLGWRDPNGAIRVTWAFVLEPQPDDATRLMVRVRGAAGYRFHRVPTTVSVVAIRFVHFVMERKQLLNVARRAESAEPLVTSWPSGASPREQRA